MTSNVQESQSLPWPRAFKIGGTTGVVFVLIASINNISATSHWVAVSVGDILFRVFTGAIIHVPSGIVFAAVVLHFGHTGAVRVGLTTGLGLFLLGVAFALALVGTVAA